MKVHLVLLSGGSGNRMNSSQPKQFLEIFNKSILSHSINSFLDAKLEFPIVVVANPEYMEKTRSILEKETRLKIDNDLHIVAGGETRHLSTIRGVTAAFEKINDESDIIMIHDAARPLVRLSEIQNLIKQFQDPGCEIASLAGEVIETILLSNTQRTKIIQGLDRNALVSIKTPQAIKVNTLKKMLQNDTRTDYTDLLTFGLAHNIHGKIVPAEKTNIKITRPEDILSIQEFI